MLHKVMVKKLGMVLLAVSASALLSGCLVDKKKPEDVVKISRSTEFLRIYQGTDWIEYDVTAVTNGTPRYGTLRIQWDDTAVLTDPITPTTTYDVLKETTTLTYDGSIEPDLISARYISQVNDEPAATNQGSIILYAIDDEVDADYWLYPLSSSPPNTPVITPTIFESPLSVGSSAQSFSVMECDPNANPCANEIYRFNDDISVVDNAREITTNLGIFTNPFELSFSGGTSPGGATLAIEFLGDIRDACGTSADQVIHNGNMFVMPEIGMIQMTNQCQNISGEIVNYIITIRDTSFSF